MPDLVVRPLDASELDLFTSFADASCLGIKPPTDMYLDGIGKWYRPEWSWLALRDGEVVARVAFSGPPDEDKPFAMGSLEIGTRPDRVPTGTALVQSAYLSMSGTDGTRPEYHQFLPVDWHDRDDACAAVEDRLSVARNVGLILLAERLQLAWVRATGLPDRRGRLTFRPAGDDALVRDVIRGTFEDTLDARVKRDVERDGADRALAGFLDDLPGPRSLRMFAYDQAGECVGIAVPCHRPWGPDVGYIGVLPPHRGNGYAEELLVETALVLAAEGADEIGATTDVANAPMAAAFEHCGYTITDRVMIHV